MRTAEQVFDLVAQMIPHITERYLDPKNAIKGSHRRIRPVDMVNMATEEGAEVVKAFLQNEGLHRELQEIGDAMLCYAYRGDQILKELKMEDDDVNFSEDMDELQEDESLLFCEEEEGER